MAVAEHKHRRRKLAGRLRANRSTTPAGLASAAALQSDRGDSTKSHQALGLKAPVTVKVSFKGLA